MIKWLKRSQQTSTPEPEASEPKNLTEEAPKKSEKTSLYSRFKSGLRKTRQQLGEGISQLLLSKKSINAELLDELEVLLLRADLGVETSKKVLKEIEQSLSRNQLLDGATVYNELKKYLETILVKSSAPLVPESDEGPFVILMIGINGAGKTTTIGKLAKQFQEQGKKVMLAAADTFRAAAIEQLKVWGERNNIPVIAQQAGSDSASVVYDALQAALARKVDILLVDTAGRLHTQANLMQELQKVKRVMQKLMPTAPQETMLVLDGSIGQNALNQALQFHESIKVTGITMTKLDGTAKGGILFAIADALALPFRYIGVGEGIEDLRAFDAKLFVEAIFGDETV